MADATSETDAVVAQPVSAPLTRAAIFLVVTINPGEDNRAAVRSFCADFAGLVRAVEFRDLEAGLSCVMGVGSDAWDRLFGDPRPAELHPFREFRAGSRQAIATPGDLLVPYPRQADGPVLRDRGADHGQARGRSDRGRRGARLSLLRRPRPSGLRRRHREPARTSGDRRRADRRGGSRIRRRQLCDHAEIPARSRRMERAADRDAGAHHRPHEALRHRTRRLGQADIRA